MIEQDGGHGDTPESVQSAPVGELNPSATVAAADPTLHLVANVPLDPVAKVAVSPPAKGRIDPSAQPQNERASRARTKPSAPRSGFG